MATKQGEKLIAVNVPDTIDSELSHAAIRLRKWIVRPKRALDKGPMMAYLSAWFVDQSIEDQVAIISAGQRKVDAIEASMPDVDRAGFTGAGAVEVPRPENRKSVRKSKGTD